MKRTHWKNQFKTIESASNFHNRVGEIFCKDPYFKAMQCYQEIAVVELIPDYPYRNHHYDWYIPVLNTIIELHGVQHYRVVNFGNVSYAKAHDNFTRMQQRDLDKKEYAVDAGYDYVEISFKHYKKLDATLLKQLIMS